MVRENQADAMLCVVKQNLGKEMLAPKYPMVVEYTAAVFKKETIPNWNGIGSLVGKNLIMGPLSLSAKRLGSLIRYPPCLIPAVPIMA